MKKREKITFAEFYIYFWCFSYVVLFLGGIFGNITIMATGVIMSTILGATIAFALLWKNHDSKISKKRN